MTNSPAEAPLVDIAGEPYHVDPGTRFSIRRDRELILDTDNLFLHRSFLILEHVARMPHKGGAGPVHHGPAVVAGRSSFPTTCTLPGASPPAGGGALHFP